MTRPSDAAPCFLPDRVDLPWSLVLFLGDATLCPCCRRCKHYSFDICFAKLGDMADNVPDHCPVRRWLLGEFGAPPHGPDDYIV